MKPAAHRTAWYVGLAAVAASCANGTSARPTVDAVESLPPRFTHAEIEGGLPLVVDGSGIERATLWTWDDHPGPVDRPFVSDEQHVPQPVATDDGDAAVALRGGAFCYFAPTIHGTAEGALVDVVIEAPTDEELLDRGVACSAAEEIVIITFDLADGVEVLEVDGVAVPFR